MSNVTRICSQCSHANPLDARYCGHCGYDFQSALPVRAQSNLPEMINKAALPVLATAAGLVLSAGWKLLQSLLENQAAPPARQTKPEVRIKSQPPAPSPQVHHPHPHLLARERRQRPLAPRRDGAHDRVRRLT